MHKQNADNMSTGDSTGNDALARDAIKRARAACAEEARLDAEEATSNRLESLLEKRENVKDVLSRKKKLAKQHMASHPKKTKDDKDAYRKMEIRVQEALKKSDAEAAKELAAVDSEIKVLQARLASRRRANAVMNEELHNFALDLDRASGTSESVQKRGGVDQAARNDSFLEDVFNFSGRREERNKPRKQSPKKASKSLHKSASKSPHKPSSKSPHKHASKSPHKHASKSPRKSDAKSTHKSDSKSLHKSSKRSPHKSSKSSAEKRDNKDKMSPRKKDNNLKQKSPEKGDERVNRSPSMEVQKTSRQQPSSNVSSKDGGTGVEHTGQENSASNGNKGEKEKCEKHDQDAIIRLSAATLTRFIMDWQISEGEILRIVPPQDRPQEAPRRGGVVPLQLGHERELELAVLPGRLRGVRYCDPDETELRTGDDNDTLARLFHNMTCTQNLHSLALVQIIGELRAIKEIALTGKEVPSNLEKLIKKSTEAVLLASDRDLAGLPFTSIDEMLVFLRCPERIEKLSIYVMTYMAYGKDFPFELLNLLIHPDLQANVYWTGTRTKLPGALFLPPVFELFVLRVARGAHEIRNFQDGQEFDEDAFKLEAKHALYNSERNARKRRLAVVAKPIPKKRRAKSPLRKSGNLYTILKELIDYGPSCKADLVDALKKTALVMSGDEKRVEAYDLTVDVLAAAKNAPSVVEIDQYIDEKKEALLKIDYPN